MLLQGTIQGALYGARALAQGTGPIIFAAVFAAFTRDESPFPKFAGRVHLQTSLSHIMSNVFAAVFVTFTRDESSFSKIAGRAQLQGPSVQVKLTIFAAFTRHESPILKFKP